MDKRNRNRLVFLAIVLVFAAPLLGALALSLAGWRPQATRNYGTLVQPPQDVGATALALAGGAPLVWRDPQWHWTLLAFGNGACGAPCQSRLAELMRMRITLGRNAERLRVVYVGPPLADAAALAPLQVGSDPAGAFASYAPPAESNGLTLALVDPNGLLLLKYPDAYDAARLRADIVKVVH